MVVRQLRDSLLGERVADLGSAGTLPRDRVDPLRGAKRRFEIPEAPYAARVAGRREWKPLMSVFDISSRWIWFVPS